ncbi:hypothetical protein JOC70_001165 [Clostridium pascui]|uniref:hypothetical protein n=1 Tax=Clostridium pascui TaxID=46609 RepID=UPI001958ACF2|nr:hypothetical protein [Clostridium pascui]MBM7869695.1 hypothetical protein [Clostridium pascui]
MKNKFSKLYLELIEWRDDEIKYGHMEKAKRIQKVIRRKKKCLNYIYNKFT